MVALQTFITAAADTAARDDARAIKPEPFILSICVFLSVFVSAVYCAGWLYPTRLFDEFQFQSEHLSGEREWHEMCCFQQP